MTDQTKFRLNKINYFNQEINQRKLSSKKLSKYLAAFDYIDKVLIVLSATSGGCWIFLSVSVVGAPIGIAGSSFAVFFSLTTEIITKLLSITRKKKKKHDKIPMFAKSKLNSIETLVSLALIDMKISHEEFILILREKDKYEIKENLRYVNEKQGNMGLNSVNSKFWKKWVVCKLFTQVAILTVWRICRPKIIIFCCIYKNEYTYSIHCRSMKKKGVEVIEYGGEIWVNQKHLEKKLGIANISDKTQYCPSQYCPFVS